MTWLLVGLGGFLGAILRYLVGGLVHRRLDTAFPAGTLVVNTSGCLAIGVMMSLVQPVYEAIVRRARQEGLAGATVLRGLEGFGARSRIHTTSILRLSQDLPIVVEIVDRAERIHAILPMPDEMVTEGMMTLEKVHIIAYRHGSGGHPAGETP